jgi:hypothetical protein
MAIGETPRAEVACARGRCLQLWIDHGCLDAGFKLGIVLGEPIGTWVHTRKVDVSQAASVCLVGESYDSAASARNALAVSAPEVVEQTK